MNVGAVAIFLAWIVLVLFVRKFPMFGIYIVMFEDIVFTFLRFSVILGLFTVAFGLAFYTMLHRHWVSVEISSGNTRAISVEVVQIKKPAKLGANV